MVELRVTMADLTLQPAASQTGIQNPGPRLWGLSASAGALGKLLTALCLRHLCRAGSVNVIIPFALGSLLSLSLCWLPGLADHSDEFFLGNIPVLSESGHVVYGQLMAGGLPSLNGIFFLGAEELHFADQEKVRLDGSDVWWHVIGRPGILVLDSSQAFGCPSAPNLCLSPLWILHTA